MWQGPLHGDFVVSAIGEPGYPASFGLVAQYCLCSIGTRHRQQVAGLPQVTRKLSDSDNLHHDYPNRITSLVAHSFLAGVCATLAGPLGSAMAIGA